MSVLGQSLQQLGQAVSPAQLAQAYSSFQDIQLKAEKNKRFKQHLTAYDEARPSRSKGVQAFFSAGEKMNPSFRDDAKSFQAHNALVSGAADSYSILEQNAKSLNITPQELDAYRKMGLTDLRNAPRTFHKILSDKMAVRRASELASSVNAELGILKNDPSPQEFSRIALSLPAGPQRQAFVAQATQLGLNRAPTGGLSASEQLKTKQEGDLIKAFIRDKAFMQEFTGKDTLSDRLALLKEKVGKSVDEPRLHSFLTLAEDTMRKESDKAGRLEQGMGELLENLVSSGRVKAGVLGTEEDTFVPDSVNQKRFRDKHADAIGGKIHFEVDEGGNLIPVVGGQSFVKSDSGRLEPIIGRGQLASELGAKLRAREKPISDKSEARVFKGNMQDALARMDRLVQDSSSNPSKSAEANRLRTEIANLHSKLEKAGATGWWTELGRSLFTNDARIGFLFDQDSSNIESDLLEIGRIQAEIQTLFAEAQLLNARGN